MVKNFLVVALFTALLCLALNARADARPLDANGNQIIGGRPSGCPFRFCGCGLAKYLGLNDKRLNLAWNWARLFPRTHAQPGAAAVRHHHVMLLEREVSPGHWQVLDFNGGRHLTWRHVRDVGGYVFVQPGVSHAREFRQAEFLFSARSAATARGSRQAARHQHQRARQVFASYGPKELGAIQ